MGKQTFFVKKVNGINGFQFGHFSVIKKYSKGRSGRWGGGGIVPWKKCNFLPNAMRCRPLPEDLEFCFFDSKKGADSLLEQIKTFFQEGFHCRVHLQGHTKEFHYIKVNWGTVCDILNFFIIAHNLNRLLQQERR